LCLTRILIMLGRACYKQTKGALLGEGTEAHYMLDETIMVMNLADHNRILKAHQGGMPTCYQQEKGLNTSLGITGHKPLH
jgi:hypothetical protein